VTAGTITATPQEIGRQSEIEQLIVANRELVEEVEDRLDATHQRLTGSPRTRSIEHSQIADDPAAAAERAIATVRGRLHQTGRELEIAAAEIAEDARWSDQHKRERIAELRQTAAAEAEAVASQAWTRVQLAEAQLTEQLRDAERRIDAEINPVAVRALAEDYRSQLDLLDDGDRMSRLRAVEQLLDQAEASSDPMRLRAVRVAVGPVLADARRSGAGDDDALSRDLLRRARGLLGIERQEADQIERQLQSLRYKRAELRLEIERLETHATGRRPDALEPTPWQRRVMGISAEHNGGGITMTDDTAQAWASILGRK